MVRTSWQSIEGEKVGQKYLLGKVASVERDQAWFHATDSERPGDDLSVVCAPGHKRAWLPSIAELKHPNLRLILAAGRCVVRSEEIGYCAMEPAPATLAERLPLEAPLSVTIVRQLISHMLAALAALHERNLVSCQISPGSIARIDGRWKLADITRTREAGTAPAFTTRRLLTSSACAPPEAFDGVISPAWDIYSLGVTINQCLLAPGAVKRGRTQRLPAPFDMLTRLCLDPDPEQRPALTDIAAILRLPPAGIPARHVAAEQEAVDGARSGSRALRWLPTGA